MTLNAGTKLGPYEILSAIGAGGMGEVYRATDTKLHRDVAIKVLPESFATDPERLARFKREAQVLASLNHPHIAQIYGLEESSGVSALVMELVEGPTLADLIAERAGHAPAARASSEVSSSAARASGGGAPRALEIAEALPIAKQIAEALEAAHELGIIHRDLKPANIKVKDDGTVKVLDFGLAKALDPAASGVEAAGLTNSPTITSPATMTQRGVILGTAAYMAPEQAKGRAVDRRADIWAFGCVLFEMLTGKRAFPGDDVSDTLASVLKSEPEWTTLPGDSPAAIRRLLRRCLAKDARQRLGDIRDARLELEDALTAPSMEATALGVPVQAATWRRAVPWGVAAGALALAAIAGTTAWRGVNRGQPAPVYASLDAPADYVLGEDDMFASLPTRAPMVFTPDGRSLIIQAARAGKPQLFLRSLDRPDARPIAGTDDARVPFVSPDGKWVGFWAANELRKVPIEGGAATAICPLADNPLGPNGATWGAGDVIVFGDQASRRIMRVSAGGGTPVAVTAATPLVSRRQHVAPALLPDGRRILFSDVSTGDAKDARVMVQTLDGGDARLVVASATDARLLPSGQLAFMRLGTLMTVPFDLTRAVATGEPVAALSGVMQSGMRGRTGATNTGAGMFAVSSLGSLAVIRGMVTGSGESLLIWVTSDGRSSSAEPASGAPAGGRLGTRISPDGSRAVVTVQTPVRRELWLVDWARDVWTACSDCNSEGGAGAWAPDGRRLLLSRSDTLVAHALDASAPDQVLIREADRVLGPEVWLADGRIIYLSRPAFDVINYEIKLLEPGSNAGRVIVPLGMGRDPAVSRDGRWLAYASAQTTPPNVFVQAFPGPGSRTQVSAGGGYNPMWSADGRTLYYLGVGGTSAFAVDISVAGAIAAGRPHELFRRPEGQGCSPGRCYDISADGQRFLMRDRSAVKRESVTRMDLVLNWTATLGKGR
jgi:eukaryotic-like serine/threonine-protein kinase